MEQEEEQIIKTVVVNSENFDDRLRELAVVTKEVDKQAEVLKELKAEEEKLSYSLAQYMMQGSVKSIVLDNIKFTQKQRIFSKVEDKEALRNWIIENDAVDLVMAVHPSKLTAYCNEQLEAGGDVPIGVNPNFIKYYVHVK